MITESRMNPLDWNINEYGNFVNTKKNVFEMKVIFQGLNILS